MVLNNIYIIEETRLKDVLDRVEEAIDSVRKFSSKHSGCKFKVNIKESSNGKWLAEINIKYEQEYKKGVKSFIEPPTLL